jgi:hypothetical protein
MDEFKEIQNTVNWNRKHQIAVYGTLTLEVAMDLS